MRTRGSRRWRVVVGIWQRVTAEEEDEVQAEDCERPWAFSSLGTFLAARRSSWACLLGSRLCLAVARCRGSRGDHRCSKFLHSIFAGGER
jgi:hypothetical protein